MVESDEVDCGIGGFERDGLRKVRVTMGRLALCYVLRRCYRSSGRGTGYE